MLRKFVAIFLAILIAFGPSIAQAQQFSVSQLPLPGATVGVSSAFEPVLVKGMVIFPQEPLKFRFIVDSGDLEKSQGTSHKSQSSTSDDVIKEESTRMVKYFLAAVTVPEQDQWVNLSPVEQDRMIADSLGQTDLGRDMLAQDYVLKQFTASMLDPQSGVGKEFWARVYVEAQAKFGSTDVPVDAFNKVWITPDTAEVFEQGNAVYVTKAHLKVMLDSDYVAAKSLEPRAKSLEQKQNGHPGTTASTALRSTLSAPSSQDLAKDIMREVVLPAIENEVNTGANFATVRQILYAGVLARWYRDAIKSSLMASVYMDQGKTKGVDLDDKTLKEQIYQRYIEAYKKGVVNFIREEPACPPQAGSGELGAGHNDDNPMLHAPCTELVARKYFTGGMDKAMVVTLSRTLDSAEVTRAAKGKVIAGVDFAVEPESLNALKGSSVAARLALMDGREDPTALISAIRRIGQRASQGQVFDTTAEDFLKKAISPGFLRYFDPDQDIKFEAAVALTNEQFRASSPEPFLRSNIREVLEKKLRGDDQEKAVRARLALEQIDAAEDSSPAEKVTHLSLLRTGTRKIVSMTKDAIRDWVRANAERLISGIILPPNASDHFTIMRNSIEGFFFSRKLDREVSAGELDRLLQGKTIYGFQGEEISMERALQEVNSRRKNLTVFFAGDKDKPVFAVLIPLVKVAFFLGDGQAIGLNPFVGNEDHEVVYHVRAIKSAEAFDFSIKKAGDRWKVAHNGTLRDIVAGGNPVNIISPKKIERSSLSKNPVIAGTILSPDHPSTVWEKVSEIELRLKSNVNITKQEARNITGDIKNAKEGDDFREFWKTFIDSHVNVSIQPPAKGDPFFYFSSLSSVRVTTDSAQGFSAESEALNSAAITVSIGTKTMPLSVAQAAIVNIFEKFAEAGLPLAMVEDTSSEAFGVYEEILQTMANEIRGLRVKVSQGDIKLTEDSVTVQNLVTLELSRGSKVLMKLGRKGLKQKLVTRVQEWLNKARMILVNYELREQVGLEDAAMVSLSDDSRVPKKLYDEVNQALGQMDKDVYSQGMLDRLLSIVRQRDLDHNGVKLLFFSWQDDISGRFLQLLTDHGLAEVTGDIADPQTQVTSIRMKDDQVAKIIKLSLHLIPQGEEQGSGAFYHYQPAAQRDAAMGDKDAAQVGGIDIKNIDVTRTGSGDAIRFDEAALQEQVNKGFDGLTPVFLGIVPVDNLFAVLGLK